MTPEQRVDLLRAACCVAGSDNEISPDQKNLIDKLARDIGVGQASVGAMIERAKRDPDFFRAQFRILNDDPKVVMGTLVKIAIADGRIDPAEVVVLRGLSQNLKLPEEVFDGMLQHAHSTLDGSVGD